MIYDQCGNRKYLTASERKRFIAAAHRQTPHIKTFCLTLVYTGARISEVLSMRAGSIDTAAGVIVLESLKKRRKGVYRQVPVPLALLRLINAQHEICHAETESRLWPWSRTTGWIRIKAVMREAGVPASCASPKALRHSFGVVGVSEVGVPLNMMQKWLGHSRIETTAIYANAVGSEERAIARRMWRGHGKRS